MNTSEMKKIMEEKKYLRDKLFSFGFLLTNAEINEKSYPFYSNWVKEQENNWTLLVHKKQKYFIHREPGVSLMLVGHAYDPFSMEYDENEILKDYGKILTEFGIEKLIEKINQLTGIFTFFILKGDELQVVGDPTCIQTNYYTEKDGYFYISTHSRLLGDLLDLEEDVYVKKLIQYKYFHLFGNSLPGDLSPLVRCKRIIPNHFLEYKDSKITCSRFFVIEKIEKDRAEIVNEIAEILNRNMKLIAKKWVKPAISLTGGCDSRTTLAATTGLYEKFSYFSYISVEKEKIDANTAHEISLGLGNQHIIYNISDNDSDYLDLEAIKEILYWNGGGTLYTNSNDIRKRCFFDGVQEFDVEVKSWCSEIGRAYYSKRFNNRKSFGKKATPRKCTTLYKVFLSNRKLVKETDKIFKSYINKYFNQPIGKIPWQEQFFWEYRIASWNSLVITGEQRFSYDITIPYNNRKLLCLFMSVPIEERIKDKLYYDVRKLLNPLVDRFGVSVINEEHTRKRARIENLYYSIHSKWPF